MLIHGAQSYGLHPCHAASYALPLPRSFQRKDPRARLGVSGVSLVTYPVPWENDCKHEVSSHRSRFPHQQQKTVNKM